MQVAILNCSRIYFTISKLIIVKEVRSFKDESHLGASQSPVNVHLLELVKSSQDTGSGDSSQDVSSGSLHQRHESLVLEDLRSAVYRALVLDSAPRGHHHSPSDGVNRIGHEPGSDGDSPAKEEGERDTSIVTKEHWLQSVEETKVHATIDEDTDSGDGESSVKSLDTIRLKSLGVDINETVELSLSALALGVIGKPGSGVVQGVDKEEGHSSRHSSAEDVHSKLSGIAGILGSGKGGLDRILECEIESLGGEISENISQVSSPEGVDSLGFEDPGGAVDDSSVGLVQAPLLDHLVLVLDQQLDSLNGSSGSLGDSSSNSSQHEVLSES